MFDNDPNPIEESPGHEATHVDPIIKGLELGQSATQFDPTPELYGCAIGHVATHVVPLR